MPFPDLLGRDFTAPAPNTRWVGDNAAAESFFSTLEHELLSRHTFATPEDAKPVVGQWCYDFYNRRRRHSKAGMLPPVVYEERTQQHPAEPANPEPEAA